MYKRETGKCLPFLLLLRLLLFQLCSVEQVGTFQVLLPPRYAIIFYCRRPAAMLHARY